MNRKPLRELLEESVQGKEDAFEELYQHYRAYIVHTAQSLIGKFRSLHQADEVVQEIWKDLWESKLEKFQGEADKAFQGWLYRVVQNHLLDQIRRDKRQPELAAPEEVDDLRSMQAWWQAQSAELQEEKIERVGGALRQLQDEHPQTARLLRRCYWDRLSLQALAAEELALPIEELSQTEKHRIAQQLYRARKQFQEIFEKI